MHTHSDTKGFTLIELLTVVAIIGILSSVIFVTIGNARPRARDAKRLADVKQMAFIITIEATSALTASSIDDCDGDQDDVRDCSGPGEVVEFADFTDPSKDTDVCGTAGGTSSSGVCQYSIGKKGGGVGATVSDYQICFYLEDPVVAGYTQNLLSVVSPIGNIVEGCP